MSDIAITVQEISGVENHPDADRLDIVKILGTQCGVGRGEYLPGEKVIYFPPDMMIPEKVADALGVKKYLKHVRWNDEKVQSRIAACRLRGVPSYGFVIDSNQQTAVGTDVTAHYYGEKYEPPPVALKLPGIKGGRQFHLEEGDFTKYTTIQPYWRYPDVFEGDNVVISEKIHGSCSRVGVLFEGGEWVFAAGSHKVRWEEANETERYWKPLRVPGMMEMLSALCDEVNNVIVYGEIFGSSVQDMDYGAEGDDGYRVFDIKVNGRYLSWGNVEAFCRQYEVLTVPVLYRGPWTCVEHVLDEMARGQTSVGEPKRKFKGREGLVIKSTVERVSNKIGGSFNPHRAILKYVSADYLDRKGAQDNA